MGVAFGDMFPHSATGVVSVRWVVYRLAVENADTNSRTAALLHFRKLRDVPRGPYVRHVTHRPGSIAIEHNWRRKQ